MVASEASKGMGPDEESFNVTVPVTQKVLYVTTDLILIEQHSDSQLLFAWFDTGNAPWEYKWKKKEQNKTSGSGIRP